MADNVWTPTDDLDVSELFPDAGRLQATDVLGSSMPLRPYRVHPDPVPHEGGCDVLRLPPDGVTLGYHRDDSSSTIHLRGRLTNAIPAQVQLRRLRAVVRDAKGALLDADHAYPDVLVEHSCDLAVRFDFGRGVADLASTLELFAEYLFKFRVVAAAAAVDQLGPLARQPDREKVALRVECPPPALGLPVFEVDFSAFVRHHHGPELVVLSELRERGYSRNAYRDIITTLRGADEIVLQQEETSLEILGSPHPVVIRERFDISHAQLESTRRIEITLAGDCERRELLGVYPLSRGD